MRPGLPACSGCLWLGLRWVHRVRGGRHLVRIYWPHGRRCTDWRLLWQIHPVLDRPARCPSLTDKTHQERGCFASKMFCTTHCPAKPLHPAMMVLAQMHDPSCHALASAASSCCLPLPLQQFLSLCRPAKSPTCQQAPAGARAPWQLSPQRAGSWCPGAARPGSGRPPRAGSRLGRAPGARGCPLGCQALRPPPCLCHLHMEQLSTIATYCAIQSNRVAVQADRKELYH